VIIKHIEEAAWNGPGKHLGRMLTVVYALDGGGERGLKNPPLPRAGRRHPVDSCLLRE